jgi:hypothetical protein
VSVQTRYVQGPDGNDAYAGFVGAKTSITPLISRTWNFGNGAGAIGS